MTITKLTKELIAVEVPKDAYDLTIWYSSQSKLCSQLEYYIGGKFGSVDLPKGNYTILGKVFKWNFIIEYEGTVFAEIFKIEELLQSKGCQLTETNKYIILKTN